MLWLMKMSRDTVRLQPLDERQHELGLPDAERGGRLVHEHDVATPEHRARDRDRLALAA